MTTIGVQDPTQYTISTRLKHIINKINHVSKLNSLSHTGYLNGGIISGVGEGWWQKEKFINPMNYNYVTELVSISPLFKYSILNCALHYGLEV